MGLSRKQQVFVEEYLLDFNATQAALRAGYSEKSAANIGWENVRKPEIAEAIQRRLQEKAMGADEVVMRLADQARADLGPYMNDTGEIDIAAMKAAGATTLLRKVKRTVRRGMTKDGGEWEHETVEVELLDPQKALELLGKHHKLFTDKTEHEGEILLRVKYGATGTDDPTA